MTIDSILAFWSQHNVLIIEVLLGVVIVFTLFLAFRSFYGAKEAQGTAETATSLDTVQLEKTLQKILENQSNGGSAKAESLHIEAPLPEDGNGEVSAEAVQLRGALAESSKKIEALQAQLAAAQAAAAQAVSAAPSEGGGDAGISSAERDELNAKLRDLEARLAEYEIISEDIADLSRYREENEDLRKQLDMLRAGGGAVAASAPAAPAVEEPLAATPEAAAVVEDPAAMDPFDAATADLAKTESTSPTAVSEGGADSVIDDELMKEFAAAVEGQKMQKVAEKAGSGKDAPAAQADDTDKLMSEFENFVTKKS